MISGVSHKICSLHREIPNSLVLFDSKKTDIEAMNHGWELARFLSEETDKPKRKYLLIQRVEDASKETIQPNNLILDSVKPPVDTGQLISFYSLILKHEGINFMKASNLKDFTHWQWNKIGLCISLRK